MRAPMQAARPVLALALAFGALFMDQIVTPDTARAEARIQEVVSPGGITAWVVEDHTLPLISVNFAFTVGAAAEPEGQEGVTQLFSYMLDEGAGDLDSFAFQSELQARSIRMSFDASRDAFYGDLSLLATETERGFQLLQMALNAPRFDDEPLERMRQAALSGIDSSRNDPDAIASDQLMAALFPGHPYSRTTEGTVETVSALTAADLEATRQRIFRRDRLYVAVVGAISPEAVAAMLDDVFGALPQTAPDVEIATVEPAAAGTVTVERDIAQSVIRVAMPGPLRDDPDFIALYVGNHILGGGSFSSRLFHEVRDMRGLAYGVYTYLGPLDHAGFIAGGAATRADRARETVEVMLAEIARFAEGGITEEELEAAKAYLIGSYPLRFDTSAKIARQVLGLQTENLGIDYPERRTALIEALTVEDVNRAIRRFYGATPTVVIVGNSGDG
ncbi:MAG: insulinase family protein [Hyphomicrobiaceae bacterium]|nr:insulinase family protein [Hyphomicrobiaceae bacterium]